MMEWNVVLSRRDRTLPESSSVTQKLHNSDSIRKFLSTFKTTPCNQDTYHDTRLCPYYHNQEKDRRRNPFEIYYDLSEGRNDVERLYHPMKYKTGYCKKMNSCCPLKNFCASAHDMGELRDKNQAACSYTETMLSKPATAISVASFVAAKPKAHTTKSAISHSKSSCLPSWVTEKDMSINSRMNLPISSNSMEWFMIKSSLHFWKYLKTSCFEEGLCQIEKQENSWEPNYDPELIIQGYNAHSAMNQVLDALQNPPTEFFTIRQKECVSQRVQEKIKTILRESRSDLIPPKFEKVLFLEINEDGQLKVCIVKAGRHGRYAMDSIFEKIDFWIKQEEYDSFRECQCCFEERNIDQGIECKNGHFICSVEECLDKFVKCIIPVIGQEGKLSCPCCQCELDLQIIAAHLCKNTWKDLNDAILDSKMKLKYASLQSDFDQRLKKKVDELINEYGDQTSVMKEKAKMNAAKIRNEVLNLKCPHCSTAYIDFTGCMALQCETCKGNFCGYCHTKTESSSGAHNHVRTCIMNETRTGSYYATEEEIKAAQRRYRTRELKKFITTLGKKEEQNATIIELQDDLNELGIEPAALFELGNLQPNLER